MNIGQSKDIRVDERLDGIQFEPVAAFTAFRDVFVQPHPCHVGLILMAYKRASVPGNREKRAE